MWIVKGFKQSAWPSRYELEIETVTKIFYDIMLFMFKRRIMNVYYVDNETSPAEQMVRT